MSEIKPEHDPTGRQPSEHGAKLDAGKNQVGLMFESFPRALKEVARVSTYGAQKYSRMGWISVPEGEQRYFDALGRHLLKYAAGEAVDKESGLLHLAHTAWNMLAVLELQCRNLGQK